jgi:transposase
VSWCDTETGEYGKAELDHGDVEAVRRFYGRFQAAVIGVESVGYAGWFHRLIDELGHTLLVGQPREVRRRAGRRHKNDPGDADGILELLLRDDFPAIHRPLPVSQQVLGLLRYRHRLVKMQTMLKNGLQGVALNEGLRLKSKLWTKAGQQQLAALELEGAGAWQRKTSLAMLAELGKRIERTEGELEKRAQGDAEVARLRTHPGVGPLTSLAVAHLLRPIERFGRTRQVAAYCGYDPREESSGERQRFGRISKQGSRLVRFLLGQAVLSAIEEDEELRRFYQRLLNHRHKHAGVAITATARKLLIRLFVMLRDQIDYAEFRRRGRDARCAREDARPASCSA